MINFKRFCFTKSCPKYTEKQIVMIVHAAPKTQPSGVQGAWFKLVYQEDVGPLFINQLPIAKPPKLINRNKTVNFNCFICLRF